MPIVLAQTARLLLAQSALRRVLLAPLHTRYHSALSRPTCCYCRRCLPLQFASAGSRLAASWLPPLLPAAPRPTAAAAPLYPTALFRRGCCGPVPQRPPLRSPPAAQQRQWQVVSARHLAQWCYALLGAGRCDAMQCQQCRAAAQDCSHAFHSTQAHTCSSKPASSMLPHRLVSSALRQGTTSFSRQTNSKWSRPCKGEW